MEKRMSELRKGRRAVVKELNLDGKMRRRLEDIGLTVGREICCRGRSPLGGIGAYEILGAVMAIRDSDADKIIVEEI